MEKKIIFLDQHSLICIITIDRSIDRNQSVDHFDGYTLKWLKVTLCKIHGPLMVSSKCNIYDCWILILDYFMSMQNANRWCDLFDWIFKWQAIVSCNVNLLQIHEWNNKMFKFYWIVFASFFDWWLQFIYHFAFLENKIKKSGKRQDK